LWLQAARPVEKRFRWAGHEVPSMVAVSNSLISVNCRIRSAAAAGLSRRPLEHRDIVAAVTDDGDLGQRNSQQIRDLG